MSRTIRNTKMPRNGRWPAYYFNPVQVALLRNPPEKYTVPWSLYKEVIETHEVWPRDPKNYVPKGTPLAEEEYGDWYDEEEERWRYGPTGRWYKPAPRKYKTYTRTVYIGRNPEHDEHKWQERRDFESVFKHVRKQGTSNRHPGPVRRDKAVQTAARRAEYKRILARELKMWFDELSNPERDCSDEMAEIGRDMKEHDNA